MEKETAKVNILPIVLRMLGVSVYEEFMIKGSQLIYMFNEGGVILSSGDKTPKDWIAQSSIDLVDLLIGRAEIVKISKVK